MNKRKIDITAKDSIDQLKIYINSILHLVLRKNDINSIQSWKIGETNYVIEIYFKQGQSCKAEYNSKEKWVAILTHIDNLIY